MIDSVSAIKKQNNDKSLKIIIYYVLYHKNLNLPELIFGDKIILRKNSVKFLGIIIDRNLKFEGHIRNMNRKGSRSIGVL